MVSQSSESSHSWTLLSTVLSKKGQQINLSDKSSVCCILVVHAIILGCHTNTFRFVCTYTAAYRPPTAEWMKPLTIVCRTKDRIWRENQKIHLLSLEKPLQTHSENFHLRSKRFRVEMERTVCRHAVWVLKLNEDTETDVFKLKEAEH